MPKPSFYEGFYIHLMILQPSVSWVDYPYMPVLSPFYMQSCGWVNNVHSAYNIQDYTRQTAYFTLNPNTNECRGTVLLNKHRWFLHRDLLSHVHLAVSPLTQQSEFFSTEWLCVPQCTVLFRNAFMGFDLSPATATIKVALQGMDREMREEYLVVIQAKDMGGHMGGLSGTTTVTITLTDINDNPPKFSKSE